MVRTSSRFLGLFASLLLLLFVGACGGAEEEIAPEGEGIEQEEGLGGEGEELEEEEGAEEE
ncbi:MAG: hypothetical protein SAJ37_21235 [Oscillatoria sp. PMC 1068.18]|nr:hypothetical protein [Oscillatoria sp. PMC 1076.18]MEC4991266.1 hypothetical protein [Oscillatoria sp. PMC 1068.18]